MPECSAIAEQLRDVQKAHGRFLALYALQCLWERGVQRLERALADVRVQGSGFGVQDAGAMSELPER